MEVFWFSDECAIIVQVSWYGQLEGCPLCWTLIHAIEINGRIDATWVVDLVVYFECGLHQNYWHYRIEIISASEQPWNEYHWTICALDWAISQRCHIGLFVTLHDIVYTLAYICHQARYNLIEDLILGTMGARHCSSAFWWLMDISFIRSPLRWHFWDILFFLDCASMF